MRATNIHDSEWADCQTELRHRNRSFNEFEFIESVEPITGPGIQPLRGTVLVRNRKTGTERTYWTGNANTWVIDFIAEVDRAIL